MTHRVNRDFNQMTYLDDRIQVPNHVCEGSADLFAVAIVGQRFFVSVKRNSDSVVDKPLLEELLVDSCVNAAHMLI